VTLDLSDPVAEILGLLYAESQFTSYPTPIQAKILGVSFAVDPWCWDLQRVITRR